MPATATRSTTPFEAARSFFNAYHAHDVNRMIAACSEDAQSRYVPPGSQGQGKVREVGKAIWSSIIDAFPDLTASEAREQVMAVKLNRAAFNYAKELVGEGKVVLDDRDDWSEHQPSAEAENEFIRLHGFGEYGKWHLGIDEEEAEHTKGRYKFPYGDFKNVHRCAVLAAESRAGQYKHHEVQSAAAHLHGMLEALKG
jgi:hypothetical protein